MGLPVRRKHLRTGNPKEAYNDPVFGPKTAHRALGDLDVFGNRAHSDQANRELGDLKVFGDRALPGKHAEHSETLGNTRAHSKRQSEAKKTGPKSTSVDGFERGTQRGRSECFTAEPR